MLRLGEVVGLVWSKEEYARRNFVVRCTGGFWFVWDYNGDSSLLSVDARCHNLMPDIPLLGSGTMHILSTAAYQECMRICQVPAFSMMATSLFTSAISYQTILHQGLWV